MNLLEILLPCLLPIFFAGFGFLISCVPIIATNTKWRDRLEAMSISLAVFSIIGSIIFFGVLFSGDPTRYAQIWELYR